LNIENKQTNLDLKGATTKNRLDKTTQGLTSTRIGYARKTIWTDNPTPAKGTTAGFKLQFKSLPLFTFQ